MTRLQIVGRRTDIEPILRRLQRLGLVELADARDEAPESIGGEQRRSVRRDELRQLLARIGDLRAKLPGPRTTPAHVAQTAPVHVQLSDLPSQLDDLERRVEAANRNLDALREEALALPRYLMPLRRLVPLVPELADLRADQLRSLRLATSALVLNTADDGLVDVLRAELETTLGARFELVWTRVDEEAIGVLVIYPRQEHDAVRALIADARVRRIDLDGRLERLSLHEVISEMTRRVAELPAEIAAAKRERDAILLANAPRLAEMKMAAANELERIDAIDLLAATRSVFVVNCWIPRDHVERLRAELGTTRHPVAVDEVTRSAHDLDAPVLLRNVRLARPFEPLVRFLDLPRTGAVDPTLLMTLVLPVMFGAMVGDVGYGIALLAVGLVARHRRPAPDSPLSSLTWLLIAGAGWSIVFGAFFGEFFGDLGQRMVGDWALWRYRGDASALEPLLLFAVVAGAAHVTLGLGLGIWQAIRSRDGRMLLDRAGMLLALSGLFGIAAHLGGYLPSVAAIGFAAAVPVGLAMAMSAHGTLGLATGPLDLLGRIGDVLSYLRLAAVGLASAHLAGVANELGAIAPIWLGVVIAAVFHLLNLALAAFSPTIQALRLHYVEFFGVFFAGGGKSFTPFGRAPHRAGATT